MRTTSDDVKETERHSSQRKVESQKQLVEDLKVEWKLLWDERFDDKMKAEGISVNDYERLFVEKGTVIHATKDFKAIYFKDILEKHMVENPQRYIQPDAEIGGWNKFIKTEVTGERTKKSNPRPKKEKPKGQNLKKGGRGWLHTT